jgi:ribosomal protein S18 acetylase RimI-like enzyme
MEVSIRDYKESDLPHFITLLGVGSQASGNPLENEEILREAKFDIVIDTVRMLVNTSGRVLGCYRFSPWPRGERNTTSAHLYDIDVLPEFQNQGYGRLLMDDAIREVRERGYVELFSVAYKVNANSMRFHSKYGFAKARIEPNRVIWRFLI